MVKSILQILKAQKKQLIIFILVGLITFLINISSFYFFYTILNIDYKFAVSFAYIFTITAHFFLHRIFTYTAADQRMVHGVCKYLLMLGINYVVLLTIMWIFISLHKSPYLAIITSTSITAIISFFVMKFFVFNEKVSDLFSKRKLCK